ncbi:MAG: hypothetical protein QM484_01340 [Woeseiaceae bacterium]
MSEQPNDYQQTFKWAYLMPNYWSTWLGLWMLWLLSYVPLKQRRSLCRFLAKKTYKKNAKRRNIIETNLSMVFPHLSEQQRNDMAMDFVVNALFIFMDYPLLLWASNKTVNKRIKFKGAEHIQHHYKNNQPVILLTCHMLALEYGALALNKHFKAVGLIKPARNALFEWLITRGRKRYQGMAELYLREKGIRPVIRAIKNLNAFYYLPDEDLGDKAETQFVPFYGVETATLTALAPMAKMTKAAVLPAVTILDEETGVYTLEVSPALELFSGEDELEGMKRMNKVLEQLIDRAPTQYMWSLRLFQTRPNGEASPYKF